MADIELLDAPFALPAQPTEPDLLAKYFKVLADPTRVRILEVLQERGELSVGELVRVLRQSQPKVSCQIGLRPGRAAVMLLANPLVRLHAASCVTQSPCKGGRSSRLPTSFPAAPYLRRGELGCAPELAPR